MQEQQQDRARCPVCELSFGLRGGLLAAHGPFGNRCRGGGRPAGVASAPAVAAPVAGEQRREIRTVVSHLLDCGYRLDLADELYPGAPAWAWKRRAYAVENGFGWAVVTRAHGRIRQRQVADKAAARDALAAIGGVS